MRELPSDHRVIGLHQVDETVLRPDRLIGANLERVLIGGSGGWYAAMQLTALILDIRRLARLTGPHLSLLLGPENKDSSNAGCRLLL